MKPPRFRGVTLVADPADPYYYAGKVGAADVHVWLTDFGGWSSLARIRLAGRSLTIGTDLEASSPEASLRSLLGLLQNLHQTIGKVVEPVRKRGTK